MPSAVIPAVHSYAALRLAPQQLHQRFVHPGPLVLGTNPLKSPAPTRDRDRTVSRRSKPSSRTTLIGEQPNPWDRLQPQDVMSRHRGAKPPRRCELLAEISPFSPPKLLSAARRPFPPLDGHPWRGSACSPRRTFYPLSDGPSIRDHRITKAYFRTCSTCRSRSQAPFCLCALRLVSNQPEGTFARLRYFLGGDRPSQTTRLTMSWIRITDLS